MSGDFWMYWTWHFMLHASRLQRPPRLPNIRFITVVTADLAHQTHHPLLDHIVFRPHQYLSKHIGGLKVHFHPRSLHHSSHLLGYPFHVWDHNWESILGFVEDRELDWGGARISRTYLILPLSYFSQNRLCTVINIFCNQGYKYSRHRRSSTDTKLKIKFS